MLKIFCWAIAPLLVAQTTWAITTEFEDLPAGMTYHIGDSFTSNGLGFKVVAFPATVTTISVDNLGKASGMGQELSFSRSVGIQFQLPSIVPEVDFLFGDYFSNSGGQLTGGQLMVNGASSTFGLLPLNGTTLGGVLIAVKPGNVPGGMTGRLTLTGPIQSLTVGSTSFYIDDLTVTVPEPASAALVLAGGGAMVTSLRRRRR